MGLFLRSAQRTVNRTTFTPTAFKLAHKKMSSPALTDSVSARNTTITNVYTAPPPAVRLYRHALESIFAFLDLPLLTSVLRVSRSWLAAVKSMRSLQLEVSPSAEIPLRVVTASAMARHITALSACGRFHNVPVKVNADILHILSFQMAHLLKLVCELTLSPNIGTLSFPVALRQLELSVPAPAAATDINDAIRAISRIPLLESLTIVLPTQDPQISFAALATMPYLRELEINIHRRSLPVNFSDVQVDELRTLPRLRKLTVYMTDDMMRRLLRQTHRLQWQQIILPEQLNDEVATILTQLPTLTQLDCDISSPSCNHFLWLQQLPKLTEVHVSYDSEEPLSVERIVSLVSGLRCCINIEILKFSYCDTLTVAHLTDLLPRLPRLLALHLYFCTIDSLSFLAQAPMTHQLLSFDISDCTQLPAAELRYVHALRGLKTLVLWRSFDAPLNDYCQSLYTPPSLLLPRLETFTYY